jgi:hypothetical protein
VSVAFEVVCVTDQAEEDEDTHDAPPRQRPLLAVDFGHAVWLEYVRAADEEPYERGQKRLRFVSFPDVRLEGEGHAVRSGIGGGGGPDGSFEMEGAARTLAIPKELDLHEVETINIDQSQGAVILSVRQGKIFILCYEQSIPLPLFLFFLFFFGVLHASTVLISSSLLSLLICPSLTSE